MARRTQVTQQVTETLGDTADGFDIPAIVEAIYSEYGPQASMEDVPEDEYWKIVKQHENR